jgi:uncharacterized protein YecE (DUF72 family)
MGQIRIGCSGWTYPHWRGRFYPAGLPAKRWFEHYAAFFDTVEINSTFYRLPQPGVVRAWAAQAPPGFVYAVKASRYVTHMKKLGRCRVPMRRFLAAVRALGGHLGPLLYQLPPHWRCDRERLRQFLALLPREQAHVFELRDRSWLDDRVLALLDEHGASVCVHDLLQMPRIAVGPVAYVRFHGTRPPYAGGYARSRLRTWVRWLREQAEQGRETFAYFNNDAGAQAVTDARALRMMIDRS